MPHDAVDNDEGGVVGAPSWSTSVLKDVETRDRRQYAVGCLGVLCMLSVLRSRELVK